MTIQRIYPTTAHLCSFSSGQGYGTHTAAGTWTYSASGECAPYADDLYGALDETGYAAARSMGGGLPINNGRFEWIFGDPPQNVVVSSLTLVGWFRTSSGNNVAIDTPPGVRFFVNPTGTRYYAASDDTVDLPVNRNSQVPKGTFAKWSRSWATNPETGVAWTRADLVAGTFKAGLASDGTYGTGIYTTTGGSTASFDVASFYIELDTTPTALYIDPVRQAISHQLRMLRRALRVFTVEVPPEFCRIEPGDTVWSSHDLLPWGPGTISWQQVPLYLLKLEERLMERRRRLTFLDLRDQYASFWSPFRVNGVDEQNSGLAMIHRGGGWRTTRNQIAYAQRPGDGLYQSVAVDDPLLTKDGLLIQGGSDKNWILNSTFSQGSGTTFTSWTNSTGATGTLAEDTADYLIDASGLRRSLKCNAPAAGDTALVYQTTGTVTASRTVCVRLWYKNDSGTDTIGWRLKRSVDNWYWNEGGATWQAGAIFNGATLSSSRAVFRSSAFSIGGSNATLELTVGLNSVAAAAVAHVYAAEVQTFEDAGSSITHWFRRDILPTTTAVVTREKDQTVIPNSPDFRVLSATRGYARVDVTLLFSHSDMADSTACGVLMRSFALYYYRTDAVTGKWVFSNWAGQAEFATATLGDPTVPIAGTTYTIAVRWTSASEDEHGLAGQALDMWINGTKGTGATGLVTPSLAADDEITLGNDPGTTLTTPLDGYLTNLTIDSRCPTDDEMERM